MHIRRYSTLPPPRSPFAFARSAPSLPTRHARHYTASAPLPHSLFLARPAPSASLRLARPPADNGHPALSVSTCTASGCTAEAKKVALDSNWLWVHKTGTYKPNCFDNNTWNSAICADPATCAAACGLDAAESDYPATYGITAAGDALSLQFKVGSNVGSRTYLMDNTTSYTMFKLKNKEFTFDVDASQLPCGLNGALYFVEMAADGGLAAYPGNKAGAAYGTGYCDAQCPSDIKFINGEANTKGWKDGHGGYGTCCTEMDIWEANTIATAVTPHACTVSGQTRCTVGEDCTACDQAGCDLNTYVKELLRLDGVY